MYAGRKRRKPVQRAVKPPQSEGAKSNPSKRHRDRLNGELERLASLLPFPEEVTTSLDKLSILRLSVSYLRAKNFFTVALKNCTCSGGSADNSKATGLEDSWLPEGELLLQALNGFVLVVTNDGTIFYSSHTIQDYLGFHQTDIMHQSVYELVHTEDQQELRRNLHWALNPPAIMDTLGKSSSDVEPESSTTVTYNPEQLPPENSSFLERNFVCRFRCLLDNSSGFLALSLQGRLKFLRGQNQRQENRVKAPPQLALFAIATPLQPPSILEIRTKNMTFRTKHKLDFTPMACDAKGKIVLGYTEAELRVRGSGYQFIHAADMLYCAENHVRMMKTGESGLTVFRLLTKDNLWKWVQANARLVYKNGKPDYIIATQRPLMEEEGGEHLRKRSMHLPFTFATGEALLYQSSHPIGRFNHSTQGSEKNGNKSKKGRIDRVSRDGLDPGSLLGALMSQAESVYVCQPALEPQLSFHSSLFGDRVGFSDSDPTALLQGWDESSNGVVGPGLPEPASSFDPMLATLDSLSLGGPGDGEGGNGENCSNGELFGALEGLGLSAEDLELLLLDERMIRVEMDPERVPTLDDLLTNDEILSYIHDSLEAKTDGAEDGDQVPSTIPGTNALETTTKTTKAPFESNPTSATNVYPQYIPHNSPIVQQMQKHLNMQPGRAVQDWVQHSNHLPHPVVNGLQGQSQPIHNGEWTSLHILANTGVPVDDCHTPQTLLNGKVSEPEGDHHWRQAHQRQHYLQQQQALVQIPLPHSHAKHPANLNGVCGIPNTLTEYLPAGKQQWQDYSYCPPGQTTLNSNPPGQTTLNSNPPGQTTLNSNPPRQTTLNSNPTGQTTLNSNPPRQTTLNSNPPRKTTLNSNPPGQTTLNSNPPGQTTLNSNPTGKTTLNSNPTGKTTLNSNPPGQTTLNSNPPGETTLNSNPSGKTTLNSNPPGKTTLNSNPPGKTTLNSNPPGKTTLNSNPPGKTTQNSNPPGKTTLNSNPPGKTTLNSNPPGKTTLNSNPPGKTTLNSNPPGKTTLNSNPPGKTTLNSNPPGQTTLNSNPSGQTTLYSNPSGQTTLNSNPSGETILNSNPCLNDGQVPLLTHTTVDVCMNYTMADVPGMDYTINRCTYGGNGQHHATGAAVSSYQRMNHKQQQQEKLPPPLAQVQCPPPSATVEQILVVGHSSLEANGMVTSDIPHQPNHSKMENGCILNGTYSGGCVLPNRSGAL
ncbi:aryl hydrocarbon receptor-like [Oncorhynchus kisutch]|uniref:Aryl hydrocarbon receptor n=1 Tax=Oncorhynchus kisutch TaxID=8019 RepID=A0A8C7DKD0_ONCKI|nr:aryl hydrocarbon receptor-like [Oncorhynchus kisutch]